MTRRVGRPRTRALGAGRMLPLPGAAQDDRCAEVVVSAPPVGGERP